MENKKDELDIFDSGCLIKLVSLLSEMKRTFDKINFLSFELKDNFQRFEDQRYFFRECDRLFGKLLPGMDFLRELAGEKPYTSYWGRHESEALKLLKKKFTYKNPKK